MESLTAVILGIPVLIIIAVFVWESSNMISEKRERQRNRETDYYDNPIKKKDE